MDKAIGNLIVTLSFDSTEFDSGVSQAQRQLKNFERATKNSGEVAKQTGYSLDSSKVYVNNMKETYKALNHTLQEQTKDYDKLGDAHGKDSARRLQLGAQMEQTKAKMIALNKEYDREVTNIAKANSKWYQGSEMVQNLGKGMSDTGQKIQSFGNQWTKASAVITIAGGSLGKVAMDFEKGMIDVQKTTNQSDEEIAALGLTLRELSTEMPIAVSELQALAEAGGRFNIPKDKLAEFAEKMAMVGTATDMTAETAAEQFARLSNITGLGVDDFSKFASSLVGLGNNMATTESAVMNMAMGMAGTLSSLGMADQDILGISAAMSSLGIESERGASSVSKFFVDLETMVQGGAEELADFAKVAGLSVDDFSTKFKESPTDAFQAFIKGLNDIQSEGGSVIETLDSLGINEIRLRDTLLRLAGGSDTLTRALEISGSAWTENTALQEEYDNQLKSTAAQREIFKNKLTDVAISAGNALLPVFTELMDSSDGLIEGIKDLAEWFVNLDDSTKGFIAKAALAGVALGPIISGVGTLTSFGGGIIQLFGGLGKGLSMLDVWAKKKTLGTLAEGMGELTTASTGAGTALGGLKTAGLFLTNPAFWAIAGTAVLATMAGHFLQVHQEAENLKQFNMDWGGLNLNQVESEHLSDFAQAYTDARVALEHDVNTSNSATFNSAIDNMATSLRNLAYVRISELRDEIEEFKLFLSDSEIEERENKIKEIEEATQKGTYATDKVTSIKQTAKDEGRTISSIERQEMSRLLDIAGYAEATVAGDDAQQIYAIQKQLSGDLTELNDEMLQNNIDSIDAYMREAGNSYEKFLGKLETAVDNNRITQEQADQAALVGKQNLYKEYENMESARVKADWERTKRALKENGINDATALEEAMRQRAEITGQSFEEYKRLLEMEYREISSILEGQIDTLNQEMSYGAFEASERWNDFIFELQKNNEDGTKSLYSLLKEAGATAEGWNELEFALHNAELDSDTKEVVAEAIMQNSLWNDLSFETKVALIEKKGESAVREMIEMLGGDWEALSPQIKTIMAQYEGAEAVEEALYQLGFWQELEPDMKHAVLEAQIPNDELREAIANSDAWNNAEFISKFAQIDTNAPEQMDELAQLLSVWTDLPVEEIKKLWTETNADSTTSKIDGVNTAMNNLNGKSASVSVNVTDNASWVIQRVTSQLNSLSGRTATAYVSALNPTATYAKGTSFHPGGLAILGDGGRHEPFLTPSGNFGVSPNRDTLFDLPRGTKVWSSLSDFMSKLPRFATGTERSFLDKIKVPNGFMNQSNIMSVGQGDTNHYEINFTISDVTIRDDRDIKILATQVKREFDQIANKKRKRVATP